MRTAGIAIAGILALAQGCGGPCECDVAAPDTSAEAAATTDAEVEEGAGWTRQAPGTWRFAVDGDRAVDGPLLVEPASKVMITIPLPSGARGATVSKVIVTYAEPGAGTWTVHPHRAGALPAEPLASMKATINGGRWADVAFDPPPTVTDRFVLVFEGADDRSSIMAINAPMDGARVQQLTTAQMLLDVPMTPLVRVELTNVH